MATSDYSTDRRFTSALPVDERVNLFLRSVYGWMCTGLAITATTAWFIAGSPAIIQAIASNRLLFWVLMGAQLGLVFTLSARVDKMAASTAGMLSRPQPDYPRAMVCGW